MRAQTSRFCGSGREDLLLTYQIFGVLVISDIETGLVHRLKCSCNLKMFEKCFPSTPLSGILALKVTQ